MVFDGDRSDDDAGVQEAITTAFAEAVETRAPLIRSTCTAASSSSAAWRRLWQASPLATR